jgi:hypothetical protein
MRCHAQNSYAVNVLLAGYDTLAGPQLFWLDYLASLAKACARNVRRVHVDLLTLTLRGVS